MSSAIYNQLTSKITSEFYKQLIFKIKILAEERDFICEKVEVARARLETPTNEVVYWLRQADEFLASAQTFMGTLEQNNTWWGMRRSKLRKQGYQLLNRADELTAKGFFDHVSRIDRPVNVPQVPHSGILGMEDSLKELQECINNEEVGTIGICGVGGIGKTALLRVIFNRSDIVENFDIAIFIHVSADTNVKDLQKKILMRLQIREQQNENQFTQAASIQRMLTGRKYLLALDDVWQRLDLETIGIPYPNSENGCKVIFTTRMEGICVEMKAHKITLKPLSQEHAWDLFCTSAGLAGSVIVSQPEISVIIRQIIEKCNGSPLALIVIGRQLVSRTLTLAEVRDLLHEINNSLRMDNSVPDDDKFSPISQTLELSYEHLDNQLLKDCFLYCSLFPEGYSITTEELISYWIAEGFFDTMVDLASTYDIHRKAHDLIRQLKCRSFLEEGKNPESEVIMHDLLHSFALMKMKNKFFVSVDREQTPKTLRLEEVERVSLMDSNIKSLDEFPYCPRLLTLILRRNACLKNLADRILQSHMLQVLDLSKTGIREIPSSIGSLIELGYLDLSFTKIKSLPKQLRQLVKLKYLGLEGTTKLTTVPGDVINNLSNVMVLNLYDSYGDWQVDEGPHMESRASMEELQSLTRVSDIGITICNTPSFRRFLKSPAALMSSTR